jgi:CheY-like chemotaxis protein
VLIAAPAHLAALKARPELGEIIAFADADVLQALEAITSLRPDVVALEKMFADTSRGAALINRIKADPTLKHCEVRLVLHDGGEAVIHELDKTPPTSVPCGEN